MYAGKETVEGWRWMSEGNGDTGEMEERVDARKIMQEWLRVHLGQMRNQRHASFRR